MDFLSILLIFFLLLVAAIMIAVGIGTYENAKKIKKLRSEVRANRTDAVNHFVTYDALFRAVKNRLHAIEERQTGMEDDRK